MNERERMVRFAQQSMRMIENLTARYDADLIRRINALVPPVADVYRIPCYGVRQGSWKIEPFTINQRGALRANIEAVQTAEMFRAAIPKACRVLASSEGARKLIAYVNEKWDTVTEARCVLPGEYVRLVNSNGECIMSDTHSERLDGCDFVEEAHGDVVVTGLGLGVMVHALLRRYGRVESVTVIEIDSDVIALTEPILRDALEREGIDHGRRLRIIHADAKDWAYSFDETTGTVMKEKFDCAWHDIWPYIDGEDLASHSLMCGLYGPLLRTDGGASFQECWVHANVAAMALLEMAARKAGMA